jgi:hypothetical protein
MLFHSAIFGTLLFISIFGMMNYIFSGHLKFEFLVRIFNITYHYIYIDNGVRKIIVLFNILLNMEHLDIFILGPPVVLVRTTDGAHISTSTALPVAPNNSQLPTN